MSRREFPARVKVAAFERAKGHCEQCGARLYPGRFRYDHDKPDWFGGEPTVENCVVRCDACDGAKTYGQDIPRIAKTKRVHARHIGAKAPSRRPMACGRNSPFRKKLTGEVVPR